MPAGAITLFHLRGIRISVDFSWFVVLFLIIFLLSGFYRDVLNADDGAIGPYALALVSALLFFASILLHELGHAFVAIRHGIGISGITLWMFGGVAQLERDSDSPGTEFKIAIAGPVVTAVIVAVCSAIGVVGSGADAFGEAARADGSADISPGMAVLGWMASVNLLVLIFNLVPAFPLDGGRVARAIAWWRTGNRASATRFAATLGRGFAYLLIGFGIFVFVQGDVVSGIWLALIGFILNGSARGAVAQSEITGRIEGISVGDVMDRRPVAIPERLAVEQALDGFFLRYGYPWFPVIDGRSRFIGLLDRDTAEGVPAVERTTTTVADILARDEGSATIRDDAPLEAVLGNQALRRLGALMAVDREGHLSGVLTVDAVGRALRDPAPGT
ncbi:MAG TPA: site-2 protease family protein [Solirubrobacterales bacterium]|jgi:Zn-dependent protease|nr:site-2 protease family protein [Solirubrobacterales bacterium]